MERIIKDYPVSTLNLSRTVEVYHQDFEVKHSDRYIGVREDFVHVATVAVEAGWSVTAALEFAYRWTNNINGSWSLPDLKPNGDFNPAVTVTAPLPVVDGRTLGHRSSMMGDRFILDGKPYRVDFVGFTPEDEYGRE
jgi:hypothetical protein